MLSVTDWMQHVLWRHLDASHPMHDPRLAAGVTKEFQAVWSQIDSFVGELARRVPGLRRWFRQEKAG